MSYAVTIENFEGPFDLLLQLVEKEKLEITNISLVHITEPFLRYVHEQRGTLSPEELVDFLVIAAKLVYLKSKAIAPTLHEAEMEEGPDLATQLRAYQAFVIAAKQMAAFVSDGARSFGRLPQNRACETHSFRPLTIGVKELHTIFSLVIHRIEPVKHFSKIVIEGIMTLEEKMVQLMARVQKVLRVSFSMISKEATSRAEIVLAFLALLELTKQRTLHATQETLFEDIEIQRV